jgi:ATP-dependent helicase/DNAse subunit B
MSVVVARIKNEEHVHLLRKFIGILNEKVEVFTDEEYRDTLFSKLLEEGRKSKTLTAAASKKALKQHGIEL